jgi:hypothetical protein
VRSVLSEFLIFIANTFSARRAPLQPLEGMSRELSLRARVLRAPVAYLLSRFFALSNPLRTKLETLKYVLANTRGSANILPVVVWRAFYCE